MFLNSRPKGHGKGFLLIDIPVVCYILIVSTNMHNFEEICQMFIFHYSNPLIKFTSIDAAGFYIRI